MTTPDSLHKPYRVKPFTSTVYELTITDDNSPPTAEDGSVYNVRIAPLSGVRANVNRFGPREVMIEGVFTGTDATNADCQVTFWQWNATTEQWYCPNSVTIAGTTVTAGSLTKGSMGKVETNPNSRRGFLEVTGLQANQDIVLTVTKVR